MCRAAILSLLLLSVATSSRGGTTTIFDDINDSDVNELTVIVDASEGTANAVKNVWREGSVTARLPLRISIVNGTDNGAPVRVRDSGELAKRIQDLREGTQSEDSSLCDRILRAADVMPERSAVLAFTSRAIGKDEYCAQKAREKSCQVFVVWTGDEEADAGVRQLAVATQGRLQTVSQIAQDSGRKAEDVKSPRTLSGAIDERMMGEVSAEEIEGSVKSERVRFPVEASASDKITAVEEKGAGDRPQTKFLNVVPLRIEVSDDTSLVCLPGSQCQFQLAVTNYLPSPQLLSFAAESNSLRIQNVIPQRHVLGPSDTVVATVSYTAPAVLPDGAEARLDFVAFKTNGEKIVQSATIYSKKIDDTRAPKITYAFRGDCAGFDTPQTCRGGTWEFDATIHDPDSGIKKIVSQPYGLVFKRPFLIGTRSPVSLYNLASCCDAKVDIWSEDLQGNRVEKKLDVFNQGLLMGEIAAIVVGVILVVFIIIAAIVAVVWMKRRNRSKLVLPRYEGSTN